MRKKQNNPGFTLVELLVVIGIIALLIAMLLPALNKACASAIRVTCMARMRELGNASMMYATNNRGSLPPIWESCDSGAVHINRPCIFATTTSNPADNTYLAKYLGYGDTAKRYICPALEPDAAYSTTANQSYAYNRYLGGYIRNFASLTLIPGSTTFRFMAPWKLGQIRQSSKMVLFVDSATVLSGFGNGGNNIWFRNEPAAEGTIPGVSYHWFGMQGGLQLHANPKRIGTFVGFAGSINPILKGAVNMTFADGSVRAVPILVNAYPAPFHGDDFFIDPDHPQPKW